MQPNIVFIMTDQFRGDCMGIASHKDVKTPYLDSLAVMGDYFPNTYTACPSCIASRAALMTGLKPKNTGRVGYADGVDWTYKSTLAGELKKLGYYTKCVGKMHVHPLRNNLGFDDVLLHDGYLAYYRKSHTPYYEHQSVADDYFYWLKSELGQNTDIIDTGLECNSWVARPFMYEEKYHPTNWVIQNSIDFLRKRDRSKPFFLYTSLVRPHPPFDAPKCYFDMYDNKELQKPPIGDWANQEMHNKKGRIYDTDSGILDPELLRQAQVGYYACITHIDHQIGRLIQALQDDNSYNDTVIVFSSDHGELLGDHYTTRKSRPYQGSINVPLIISRPEKRWRLNNYIHNEIVELRDIMPTLIDIAGGDVPNELDGKSLLPLLNGEPFTKEEYIHGEHSGGVYANHYIVTETDKYAWFSYTGEEQYFDLLNDRKEMHNLINSPEHKERIDYLRNKLIIELEGRQEGYTDGKKLISGLQSIPVLDTINKN